MIFFVTVHRGGPLEAAAFMKGDRGGKVFIDHPRGAGATVVAAYSPRLRPALNVSCRVAWDDLDRVHPADFTLRTVPDLLAAGDPWVSEMPSAQALPVALIEERHTIPGGRVQAMHEGRRRARDRPAAAGALGRRRTAP